MIGRKVKLKESIGGLGKGGKRKFGLKEKLKTVKN